VNGRGQVLAVAFAGVIGMDGLYFALPVHEICTALDYC
jgi:hypothetical protein